MAEGPQPSSKWHCVVEEEVFCTMKSMRSETISRMSAFDITWASSRATDWAQSGQRLKPKPWTTTRSARAVLTAARTRARTNWVCIVETFVE